MQVTPLFFRFLQRESIGRVVGCCKRAPCLSPERGWVFSTPNNTDEVTYRQTLSGPERYQPIPVETLLDFTPSIRVVVFRHRVTSLVLFSNPKHQPKSSAHMARTSCLRLAHQSDLFSTILPTNHSTYQIKPSIHHPSILYDQNLPYFSDQVEKVRAPNHRIANLNLYTLPP